MDRPPSRHNERPERRPPDIPIPRQHGTGQPTPPGSSGARRLLDLEGRVSESVIADFMARTVPDLGEREEWVRGRVVLSRTQLVLADGDNRTTIPLTRVFDVTTGRVSRELARSVGETLTVAYERDGTNRLAVVGSDSDVSERFANVLFKALLSGTRAFVRHPTRLDGRDG